MINWTDPNPVFFDLETQSAADLKACGGRLYAQDPTTRVLSAVFLVDGVFHVWIPAYHPTPPLAADVWPSQLGAAQPVVIHHGGLPDAVRDAVKAGRTFVAHNCLGFDRFIWQYVIARDERIGCPAWADTLLLARASGYPGKLDAIAKQVATLGKDAGHRILMKFIKAEVEASGVWYPTPGAGDLSVITRYNIADVELLHRVWKQLETNPVEADVIDAHDVVNGRGVCVDTAMAAKIQAVAGESVERAAVRIEELTGGVLHGDKGGTKAGKSNLRSIPQVNAWLASKGVRIHDSSGKTTLRKDFVTQALANPWLMLDEDSPVTAIDSIDPAVFEVLRLRGAALRITDGKAKRATMRASADGRARDLLTYWQAHTGRWSSAGIQVHNLPRPRKGVPVDVILDAHNSGQWGTDSRAAYDWIASQLPKGLSVDDALSSLLRPLFYAAPGHALAICDYAAVECRGIAWIAGEESLLQAFRDGADIYKQFGARLFGKPAEEITDAERQIAKVTVLGCGYGLGDQKFAIYCALQGVNLAAAGTTAAACVDAFRAAYPCIAGQYAGNIEGRPYRAGGVWSKLARAAMDAVICGGIHEAGKTRWAYDGATLRCELPSGRVLHYRGCRVEDRIPGYAAAMGIDKAKPTLVYQGAHFETTLYGGKIAENVVQALCRDLLATALVNAENNGLPVVLHVHDELVAEVPAWAAEESLNTLANVMTTVPPWAAGFPIGVEGFAAPRYLKAAPKGWQHVKASS